MVVGGLRDERMTRIAARFSRGLSPSLQWYFMHAPTRAPKNDLWLRKDTIRTTLDAAPPDVAITNIHDRSSTARKRQSNYKGHTLYSGKGPTSRSRFLVLVPTLSSLSFAWRFHRSVGFSFHLPCSFLFVHFHCCDFGTCK